MTRPPKKPRPLTWPDASWGWDEDGALVLVLPVSQSVNRLHHAFGGRKIVSEAGRQAQGAARWKLATCPMLAGELRVTMTWFRQTKTGDVDNRLKGLLDCLKGLVYADDASIAKLSIERADVPTARSCIVVQLESYEVPAEYPALRWVA
jgi:Holliday junction resolvase RusA-like endonuclease